MPRTRGARGRAPGGHRRPRRLLGRARSPRPRTGPLRRGCGSLVGCGRPHLMSITTATEEEEERQSERFPARAGSAVPLAFVGTYPPRRCGIATFTSDLARATTSASGQRPMVIALTDTGGQYPYPPAVRYEIRQGSKGDYARAAELVNYSDVRLVSLQHEHGIFGGDDGAYILDFLTALRVPTLTTLHTVLKNPSESQRAIVRRIFQQSAGVVVMSRVARELLASSYGLTGPRVHVIAHGIPPM